MPYILAASSATTCTPVPHALIVPESQYPVLIAAQGLDELMQNELVARKSLLVELLPVWYVELLMVSLEEVEVVLGFADFLCLVSPGIALAGVLRFLDVFLDLVELCFPRTTRLEGVDLLKMPVYSPKQIMWGFAGV
jgi:hypothetical protein